MNNENRKVFPLAERPQIYFIIQQQLFAQKLTKKTLVYDKALQLRSNYTHSFVKKLLSEVQKSVMFQGYAFLKSSNNELNQIGKTSKTKACSKISQTEIGQQVISYRLDLIVLQQDQKYNRQIMQFEQNCNRIHQIIMFIMEKYKLQSKVNFWLTKFRLELLRLNHDPNKVEITSPISTNSHQKEVHSPLVNDSQKIQLKMADIPLESEYNPQRRKE